MVIWIVITVAVLGGVIYYFMRSGSNTGKEITTASGLKYVDEFEGTGATAQPGKTLKVAYTGTLDNGIKFDSSRDPGKKPYEFKLGTGSVIKGWDEGIVGMKVGGKRKLTIPPQLGYGSNGMPPNIPGNATLHFDLELVDVK